MKKEGGPSECVSAKESVVCSEHHFGEPTKEAGSAMFMGGWEAGVWVGCWLFQM
jgi:hypothetical protein